MYIRILLFLFGFGLTVVGSIYIISYLNLLTIGYNFNYYVNFIIRRLECLYFVIGLIFILISIYLSEGENYELHIWCFTKF